MKLLSPVKEILFNIYTCNFMRKEQVSGLLRELQSQKIEQPWQGDFSPLCVKEPRFFKPQRMKEINTQHHTWDPVEMPPPKAICPSLLWPWSDHSQLLFSHLHWKDKTHVGLIVSPQTGDDHWFSPLLFKKQESFVQLTDTSSFSVMVGIVKSILGKKAKNCLIIYFCSCRNRNNLHKLWSFTRTPGLIEPATSLATLFVYWDPCFSPGFDSDLWQLLMGNMVSWLFLISRCPWRGEPKGAL